MCYSLATHGNIFRFETTCFGEMRLLIIFAFTASIAPIIRCEDDQLVFVQVVREFAKCQLKVSMQEARKWGNIEREKLN